jgi:hypothetical protein
MFRSSGRLFILSTWVALFSAVFPTTSSAQDQRANRRAFVEDLLRGLIESQIPNNQNPPRDNRGNQVPGGQRVVRPVIEVSPEMRSVRENLNGMAIQYDKLIGELQNIESRSPYIRPLMADALQVRAEVDNLSRKAEVYPRVDALVSDYQRIDRDYRVLTHRLRQSHQLTKPASRCLDRIAKIDTKLCGLFGIEPQIDRRELLRLTTALRSDFQHMLQDIYYESNSRPELRPVLADGKRLYANINQATGLISSAAYPTIVDSFKGCHQQWRNFNRQLYPYADERLLRDLQQIETHGAQIRDQLYLETEVDREYLAFLSSAVNNGAANVLDLVTVNHLLRHDNPNQFLANARELCSIGETLNSSIVSGQSMDDLAWDYRLFDVQWATMHDQLTNLNDAAINQRLGDINYTVSTLRRTFGEGPAMSVDQMTQLASRLDQLTYQLDREVDHLMAAGGYSGGFARAIRKDAHQLHESVHDLQANLAAGQSVHAVSSQVRQVYRAWDKTKSRLAKLNERDQRSFSFFRSQIEPSMVKLKLVFAD